MLEKKKRSTKNVTDDVVNDIQSVPTADTMLGDHWPYDPAMGYRGRRNYVAFAETPEPSKPLSLKPEVGRNIAV